MLNAKEFRFVSIFLLIAAAWRLLPYIFPEAQYSLANIAPVAALGLFGGVHLRRNSLAFALPLVAMLASDVVIALVGGTAFFHSTFFFVYAAFALTVLLGRGVRRKMNLGTLGAGVLSGSVVFFLLTNFGVWAMDTEGLMYERSLSGLLYSYEMAIPFYKNTLLGDLTFSLLGFGGFALYQRYGLHKAPAPAQSAS